MRHATRYVVLGLALSAVVLMGGQCGGGNSQSPGVTDEEIKIGSTAPYSGPASSYGTFGRAVDAYFRKVNDDGGINGRKIKFISYDDGYSPPKTVEQARRLVEQDEVLLLFWTVGTPTNSAIWEYMNQKKVPHLFLATGASKWGDPEGHPWTIGWQTDYATEAKIYTNYILENFPGAKIGILYQNDDYGKDYLNGFKEGLAERGSEMIVAELSYEVMDPTIDSQIVALKASGADVFFNISIPKFAAQAIRKMAEIGWRPTHFLNGVSTSVEAVFKPAGLENAQGIISALFLKDPDDPQWENDPARAEYLAWMEKYYPDGNIHDLLNVYAYSSSQTMVHVLEQAGDDLSRENVMRHAASIKELELPMLLPGIKINTSPTDFYPMEQMQLARFNDERWERFGPVIDASRENPGG